MTADELALFTEIRDILKKILAVVGPARPDAPKPILPLPTAVATPVPGARSVSCPYCKSGVGQPCSSDANELPVKAQDGFPYHASRMRAVGLWPPKG